MPKPATLGSEELLGYGLRLANPLMLDKDLSIGFAETPKIERWKDGRTGRRVFAGIAEIGVVTADAARGWEERSGSLDAVRSLRQ